jgi:hypothetical protein
MTDSRLQIASTACKRKPATYAVRVKTTAEWYGTVEASSVKEAKRKAEEQYNDGELTQCGEDIEAVIAHKVRTRIGSWNTFERRFKPIVGPDGALYWRREQLPKDIDVRCVWTIVEGDSGRLYVSPGYRFVNRIDCVVCEVPRSGTDDDQPDYRYD